MLSSKIQRFIPFIIIFLVTVFFVERQKTPALLPPPIEISVLETRAEEIWEFALPDLSGNIIRLSDFKGTVVLLNFWATWCPPCREEMPSLEEVFQTNKDKGFVVLGISRDEKGKEAVGPFMKEYGLTFPVLLDPELQVFNQYFVRGIPVTYLLDRQGRVAGMYPGAADWSSAKVQALLDYLLQEPYEEKET